MMEDTRYSLTQAAAALGLVEMTVLYYIQYSHRLPERHDAQDHFYLLASDLEAYRQQHQQGNRRGRTHKPAPRERTEA